MTERPGLPASSVAAIRIATITTSAALAISGLSLAAGRWRLGLQCAGGVVLWATTKHCPRVVARLTGCVVGAVMVLQPVDVGWTTGFAPLLTIGVIVAAAFAIEDADRRWRSVAGVRVVLVWAVVSLGAVYACVPETDHIRWLAMAVGALILGEFLLGTVVETGLTTAVIGLLGWAVLYGGHRRDSAMIGGLGSFGLLIVEPLSNLMRRIVSLAPSKRAGRLPKAAGGMILVVVQVVGCLAIARSGGLQASAAAALVIVVPVLLAMLIVCWVVLSATFATTTATAAVVSRSKA